ncbi:MAG: hypothetical protein A3B11_00655 [Candidatus Taylorbacteria bacterium RIFCSPLOWO2_01_FULL_44_26]|uniref:Uncharacterized protein n=2 Tax=Candidatus Tayloriibacteriota TaxID=1817919 RepID=A0A1G2MLE2_9BACT|nr:MAG: hypothetical protein A3D50_00570 [Candidatus Taylorbacteria bacterium RIFCSPHIGHO2_02_FULL_44_12]OHA31194.1 MAG: hypothetical protein A3B11_00655 [Candidatus Taylorbacteria bacterium RIFCSPLOWO2_01_FULL_44_26]
MNRNRIGLILVIIVTVFVIFSSILGILNWRKAALARREKSVQIQEHAVPIEKLAETLGIGVTEVTTQKDGTQDVSVIVHDRGASFVMAPMSNRSPTVVPEQQVREMQRQRQKQQ